MESAETPKDSYSFAFKIGSKFSLIIPALGDAFFISAMIASVLFSRLFLKLLSFKFWKSSLEINSSIDSLCFFSLSLNFVFATI